MANPTEAQAVRPAQRTWALVRWQLRVLRTQRSARFARWMAGLVALGFVVGTLGARTVSGPGAIDADLAVGAARLAAWVAAGPLLLGAAQGSSLAQRLEGRELYGALVGASERSLVAARALAVALGAAVLVALPSTLASLAVLGASTSGAAAWERARVLVALWPFAFVTGALLGPLAVVCDRLAQARGRSLFLAVVLLPFLVADPLGLGPFSVPGLLEAVLDLGLWLLGLERLT